MHCWPRYLLWLLISVLGIGHLLAACGQTGPLYLPDSPTAETVSEIPQPEPEIPEQEETEAKY